MRHTQALTCQTHANFDGHNRKTHQRAGRRLTHIFSLMANTNSLKVEAPSTSDQLVNKLKINKYTHTLALIFMLHGQKNPLEENNFRVDNKGQYREI